MKFLFSLLSSLLIFGLSANANTEANPTIITDITVECDGAGNTTELNDWLANHAYMDLTLPCSIVGWNNDFVSLTDECGQTGFALVTFTAVDACNNSDSFTASFTIIDTTTPLFTTVPSDLYLECDGSGNVSDLNAWLSSNGGAVATDVCSGIVWYNDFTFVSQNCGATGSTTVTFTAEDECGNSTQWDATITIEDNTNPIIFEEASDEVVECDGVGNIAELSAWLDNNGGAFASDDCGDITWSNDFATFSDECGQTGTVTVVFTVADDCGNISTTTATFTIEDTTDPSIDIPASDLYLECEGSNHGPYIDAWLANNGGANSSDLCNASSIVWTHDYTTGSENTACGASGSVLVTFTATDNCGLTATTTALIIIEDTVAPTITTSSSDLVLECDGSGNISDINAWISANGGASAVDECGSITWTNNYDTITDECGATGSATIIFTATDECGNFSSTSGTFTIEDTTNPTVDSEAEDLVLECDVSNQSSFIDAWLANNGGAVGSDICSVTPIIWTHDYISDSENTNCGASGSISVTFTLTDNCGLFSTTTAEIIIEDTTSPTILSNASDISVECDGVGNVSNLNSWLSSNGGANAFDECGSVVWSNDFAFLSDECASTGSSLVTFTATDDCGNMTSTQAFFTIEDTTPPLIFTQAQDETVSCDGSGNTTELNTWLSNNGGALSGDGCSTIIWTHDFVGIPSDCSTTHSVTVTFTSTDDCGNSATTSAVFTIEASPCLPVLNLAGNNAGDGSNGANLPYYESGSLINSVQVIQSGASVTYDARDTITLNPGFETILNAEFETLLTGCNP